ncbi:response regulator [Halobacteriovorax sp. HLS]|uniref:response regulator n=1 Tax=Halobacteriovorax sp. HLS TaxID=2234000 RepID=UPI0013E2BC7F|nr:response regulator [Halobacteriovorax sp. HLS]
MMSFVGIVDDNLDHADLFSEMIKVIDDEIIVKHFINGQVFLDYLDGELKPDLVFLDITMPVLDGKSTLKRIRENNEISSIPVVILSSSIIEEERNECLTIGANDFLIKSVTSIGFDLKMKYIIEKFLFKLGDQV